MGCKEREKASVHTTNKLYVKKIKRKKRIKCADVTRSKANESEKLVSKLIVLKDHLDKSRICALLESKPLNPRKTNEFL